MGNNAADEAADFGHRRVDYSVIDARRCFSGVCGRWGPVLLNLHRFFIAMSSAVVNHDGCEMVRLLILWSGLLVLCQRGVGWYMLCVIMPCDLDLRLFGLLGGSMFRLLLLVLGMLLIGLTLLVSWLSGRHS